MKKTNKPAIEGGVPIRADSLLVFGAPRIEQEDIDEVVDTLKSGWLSTGPKVKRLEQDFAAYNNMLYAVGTNSCTSALHLCLNALNLNPADEVITTSMTFCATVNSIIHAGATPVLADCNVLDCNISTGDIEKRITRNTRAIIPVHFAGAPCDMEDINSLAQKYDLHVISDAAHAIETRYKGKSVAEFSDMTAYSFYATKNICVGEGGMVLTNNEQYAKNIRVSALHGMSKNAHLRFGSNGFKHYSVDVLGYKYNMTDIVASLGIHQLERVEESWKRRKEIWRQYMQDLDGLPLYLPFDGVEGDKLGYHLFTVHLHLDALKVDRDFVLDALIAEGIGTGVHYKAVHTHPYYQSLGLGDDFPNAQWVSERTLSLPLGLTMTNTEVAQVVESMHKILNYYRK